MQPAIQDAYLAGAAAGSKAPAVAIVRQWLSHGESFEASESNRARLLALCGVAACRKGLVGAALARAFRPRIDEILGPSECLTDDVLLTMS